MIARCITTAVASIADATLSEHVRRYVHMEEVALVVGQDYIVFGVIFRNGVPWYLICENDNDDYPIIHCSVFFDLINAKVCEDWVLSFGPSNVGAISLLPQVWGDDASFLERLVDGDVDAIATFGLLKKQYRGRD
jgi:hypothetical protein